MANRLRKLKNDSGAAWVLSAIGLPDLIHGSELTITNIFTDSDISNFLQNGNLTLAANRTLVVEDPVSAEKEISSVEEFGVHTKPQITSHTQAEHDHASASGGGTFSGWDALTDASYSLGGSISNEIILATDSTGVLDLGTVGDIKTSRTSFSSESLVNKTYVDNAITGLDPKGSVRLVSAGDLGGVYTGTPDFIIEGPQERLQLDGINVNDGDRILINDQTSASENGIYVVVEQGDGATAWEIVRAPDFNRDEEITHGAYCLVTSGNTMAGTGWIVTSADPIILDTDDIDWEQFIGPGTSTGGNGIDVTGNVISVDAYASGAITATGGDGTQVDIKSSGVTKEYIGADVVGDGLVQELDGSISVIADTTGSFNVATVINIDSSDGIGVKIDNDTIGVNGSDQLYVKNAPTIGQMWPLYFGKSGALSDGMSLIVHSGIFGSLAPYVVTHKLKVIAMSVYCGTAPVGAALTCDFIVAKNGVQDASATLSLATTENKEADNITTAIEFAVEDELTVEVELANASTVPKDCVVTVMVQTIS